jgi:hypothetical protein
MDPARFLMRVDLQRPLGARQSELLTASPDQMKVDWADRGIANPEAVV